MAIRTYESVFSKDNAYHAKAIRIIESAVVPKGVYAFVEMFCDNPKCDCKTAVIEVTEVKEENNKFRSYGEDLAVIDFSWAKRLTCSLNKASKDDKISHYFLKEFRKLIKEKEYVKKIQEHYNKFKKYVTENSKKIGRNSPCPCGSGKKFKKCCGKIG